MKQDIRLRTCLIIKKGNEYLVALTSITRKPMWSTSQYDAWQTRCREDAERVARYFGAQIYLFNPIVGQLRRFKNA